MQGGLYVTQHALHPGASAVPLRRSCVPRGVWPWSLGTVPRRALNRAAIRAARGKAAP